MYFVRNYFFHIDFISLHVGHTSRVNSIAGSWCSHEGSEIKGVVSASVTAIDEIKDLIKRTMRIRICLDERNKRMKSRRKSKRVDGHPSKTG